jgi:hypothetical protein
MRPTPNLLLKTGVYLRSLYGLVSSVPQGFNPDSTIFGNTDYGTVRGFEAIFERAIVGGWGVRLLYTLQFAETNSSNAFLVRSAYTIDPATGDTIIPGRSSTRSTSTAGTPSRPSCRVWSHPRRGPRCWAASPSPSGRAP